jgi:hypothetical protein
MKLKLKSKSEIKHLLYNFSILFFTISFLSAGFVSVTDTTILETKNQNIPKHLFDVTFNLYKTQIGTVEQLRGHGTFENFGTETSELHYTVILYDDNIKKIYSIDKVITVQTHEYLNFNFDEFKHLELEPGKYTIVLSTYYGEDTKDIFVQDFYISEFFKPKIQIITFIIFSIIIFLMLFLIIFEIKKGRTKKEKKIVIREYLVHNKNKKKRLK